jgi:p-aminobenzoyl-glutamate transporter AbgT
MAATTGALTQAWVSQLETSTASAAKQADAGGGLQASTGVAAAALPPQFYNATAEKVFGGRGLPAERAPDAGSSAPKAKWYTNPLFMQAVTVVLVFLISFILLISIRPGFLYKTSEDPTKDKEFATNIAAWIAAGTAVLALIIMVVLAFVKKSGTATKNSEI